MKKLHETVKRIYDKILKPFILIEVQTENGWESIDSLNISYSKKLYEIKTNKNTLLCTPDHILIDENNNEIFAKDSLGKKIKCKDGIKSIISVKDTGKVETVYDLSLSGEKHIFYANDMLSHNCLIIDEMAFIPKNVIDPFFASVMPIVSSSKNSKVIAVSTPNGAYGLYYDLWLQANMKGGTSTNSEGWKPFRMYWWEATGRDEKWKQQQIETIGIERWRQEFECEFLSTSTKKLIPDDIIEKYRMAIDEYKRTKILPGKEFKIMNATEDKLYVFTMYHEFIDGHAYMACADVAEGIGGDSSVLYILDVSDTSKITTAAKFSSDTISMIEFAYVSNKILSLYNNPPFIVERNGLGSGYVDMMTTVYQYDNMVREGKKGEGGIFSHIQTKSKACLWLRDMMTTSEFGFRLYDNDLIDEFQTFIKKEGKGVHNIFSALNPAHDDHIMTLIWGCYMLHNDFVDRYFVVCDTFNDSLGNVRARIIRPYAQSNPKDIAKITKDPIYREFLEFREEQKDKIKKVSQMEEWDNEHDLYKYTNEIDPYFGEQDRSSFYSIPDSKTMNSSNNRPSFIINGGFDWN